jgi:hypothetical protein
MKATLEKALLPGRPHEDSVQIGLAENGGDSSQDGCAFHVTGLDALFAEFKANGLKKELSEFDTERHNEVLVERVLRRRPRRAVLLVRRARSMTS